MKSNKNLSGMVEIPAITLNALKGLLFTEGDGVDLSGIIDDLGGDDLTAINVALAFKKQVPEIDRRLRYNISYSKEYYTVYEFQRFSLIRGVVEVMRQSIYFDNRREPQPEEYGMSLSEWYELSTEKPVKPAQE